MPFWSVLHAPVLCPSCGREISYRAGETTFFWGRSSRHYWGLDDDIEWLRDQQGVIVPPYTLYRRRGWFGLRDPECNLGSPEYPDLLAFDPEIDCQPPETRICPGCQSRYDHIAVEIRGGRVAGMKVFAEGEIARTIGSFDPFPETMLIRPDASDEPLPIWGDQVLGEYRP